ncbi:DNA-binding domain-containing protein [Bacillaceae bacterium IKA-2]|jgi:two-component system response regulator YcbB|nr:DNA-binding domain-containing protein [Bacillaceae bacterium IKA-2]
MLNFYILDDDISTRKILARILRDELLGEVLGENEHPLVAIEEIVTLQPNIILIDLLMPYQDGIETVQQLKNMNYSGKFIMISQIENKDMVGKAYDAGIEYFIHKPINKIEVTSVINKVVAQIKMENSLQTIKESLSLFPSHEIKSGGRKPNLEKIMHEILTDLGILGETGSADVMELMKHLKKNDEGFKNIPLKTLYIEVLKNKKQDTGDKATKTLEQRLRRAINQALINLASLGLTDYTNPKFELFSSKFFDFNEVRLKMNELDEKNPSRNSRINIRKFLYAFYVEIQERMS